MDTLVMAHLWQPEDYLQDSVPLLPCESKRSNSGPQAWRLSCLTGVPSPVLPTMICIAFFSIEVFLFMFYSYVTNMPYIFMCS